MFNTNEAIAYGGTSFVLLLVLLFFIGAVLPAAWAGDAVRRRDAFKVLDRLLRFLGPRR